MVNAVKKILVIGTGGTIASEMTMDGLAPELTSEQLLSYVPEVFKFCGTDCIQVLNVDSTDMLPEYWLKIAGTVKENYDLYDGFVITHGTDTMAYTAAALSYLMQNLDKPVVLTGAQKPIGFDSTDSKVNLIDSFLYACNGMGGVSIVFNGKVILGTRARKTHSKSFQAFSSINYPILASIQDERLLQYIKEVPTNPPKFYDAIDGNVGLLKLIPGVEAELLRFMTDRYDAVVIESFGVGGLPAYNDRALYQVVEESIAKDKIIVMTTQVQNEGSDLSVYCIGRMLKEKYGLLEAYDMTTEAVVAKMMWILGQTKDFEKVKELFKTPVAHDILTQE